MPRKSWLRSCIILLLVASLLSPGPVFASAPTQASAGHTVLVDQGDQAGLSWLMAQGAEKLVDYGAFSLWRVPAASTQALQASAPPLRAAGSHVYLRGVTLQTDQPKVEPPIPQGLTEPAAAGAQFWMVQFAGPVLPEWLTDLQSAGLEIVAYLPEDAYVVWGDAPAQRLASASGLSGLIAWQGAYQPFYRLHPDLRPGSKSPAGSQVDVTVQLYDTPAVNDTAARLQALASSVLSGPERVLNLTNLRLRLPASQLDAIAGLPDVFNVEPYAPPVRMDEIQGQILAGNLVNSAGKVVPSGPGYLDWLASKGFPTDPAAYPIVDVVDDGIDQGDASAVLHPDFHQLGDINNPARVVSIANCTTDLKGNSTGGHGNLNAGIVAGYNNGSGFPYQDTGLYRIGLGISPYGRVAGTKIFENNGPYDVSACGNSHTVLVSAAYANGARITSNSWGDSAVQGGYDAMAQEYDALTRDADANPANGNQEMLHVFAAGNDGRVGLTTVGSPGTAKDVITVGASENVRDNGVYDNCGITAADNADDIADFSSRGPAADGRAKPDLTAPGTHIQGPASQDPGYNGSEVCSLFYPNSDPQQKLYTWSSGTSHSTPAVSGAAQLVYEYYQRVLSPGNTPSPAMLKALLLNSARYMTGLSANDSLPGVAQGWGMADLGTLFDGTPRLLRDEATLLTASGQTYDLAGTVSNPAKPFRVTLAWTDAPGSTVGQAQVNDLDLEVAANGTVYHGNVFAGANSVPGGAADALNNVESVFLPAGVNGGFRVRVVARNIAGDGVPGNASLTDQDFALVVDNANANLSPVLAATGVHWSEDIGNGNGYIEPGESAFLDVDLSNVPGAPAAQNLTAAISVLDGQANILQGVSSYADIPAGGTRTNLAHFRVQVLANQPCGGNLMIGLQAAYQGGSTSFPLPALSTSPPAITNTYNYSGGPVNIPDANADGVLVPLAVNDTAPIQSLTVTLDITHPYVGDLVLSLVGPGGQSVMLANRRGGSGDNYSNVTFDDQAVRSIVTSSPPFTGSYQPESPLAAFNQLPANGTWNLKAADVAAIDVGTVNHYSLAFKFKICAPVVWPYTYYLPWFDNRQPSPGP